MRAAFISAPVISPFAHFAESSFAKADTGTPSMLFNASATLIAAVLFVSIGTLYHSFTHLFYNIVWIITINLF